MRYLVMILIKVFLVVRLIERNVFKGGLMVATWTMLYLLIDLEDHCQGHVWFH